MTKKFFTEPTLTEAQARRIIDALLSTKGDVPADADDRALAAKIKQTLDIDLRAFATQQEIAADEEARRAERAEKAILTPRQAMALAAVRAGKTPWDTWESWMGTPMWRRGRSMGGAINRMVATLVDEGLLTERRALTDGGLARLEAWETKHGRIGNAA